MTRAATASAVERAVDNLYVCYTAQNYLKALYLAHQRFLRGERSKILALFVRGAEHPTFFATSAVFWADVEHVPHDHRYVRVLPQDRRAPLRMARVLGHKARLKLQRWHSARPERARVARRGAARAARVSLPRAFVLLELPPAPRALRARRGGVQHVCAVLALGTGALARLRGRPAVSPR
jgi:hypothetical protein